MRKVMLTALAAGQLLAGAAPAVAQSYAPVRETGTGAFGGVRVRIPIGSAAVIVVSAAAICFSDSDCVGSE